LWKSDKVWESMREYERVWESMREHERVWESMREYERVWESMIKYTKVLAKGKSEKKCKEGGLNGISSTWFRL